MVEQTEMTHLRIALRLDLNELIEHPQKVWEHIAEPLRESLENSLNVNLRGSIREELD